MARIPNRSIMNNHASHAMQSYVDIPDMRIGIGHGKSNASINIPLRPVFPTQATTKRAPDTMDDVHHTGRGLLVDAEQFPREYWIGE